MVKVFLLLQGFPTPPPPHHPRWEHIKNPWKLFASSRSIERSHEAVTHQESINLQVLLGTWSLCQYEGFKGYLLYSLLYKLHKELHTCIYLFAQQTFFLPGFHLLQIHIFLGRKNRKYDNALLELMFNSFYLKICSHLVPFRKPTLL